MLIFPHSELSPYTQTHSDFMGRRPYKGKLKTFIFAENVVVLYLLFDQCLVLHMVGTLSVWILSGFDGATWGDPVLLCE